MISHMPVAIGQLKVKPKHNVIKNTIQHTISQLIMQLAAIVKIVNKIDNIINSPFFMTDQEYP